MQSNSCIDGRPCTRKPRYDAPMNTYPLPTATLESAGISSEHIGRLATFIDKQIADGHYPGAQIALARHGKLLLDRSFGQARQGTKPQAAASDTLWLLYSNTKVVFATAMWQLLEQGVITHQGGFPNAAMPKEGWLDHAAMRRAVCDFALEWTPGSKVVYHGLSAHWVMAAVMEAVTGRDFREVVRDNVLTPLGLAGEITVGLRPADDARAADMHEPVTGGGVRVLADTDNDTWKRAGAPGGGGYGTARGMVALYQMMLAGGTLGGISSGQDVLVSMAIKPTSSIVKPGRSIDVAGQPVEVVTTGRHDPCVLPRAVPIVEAMAALVAVDHWIRDRGQNAPFGRCGRKA